MIIHRCDSCGKEMSAWISITTKPDTVNSFTNISDLLGCQLTMELCEDCYIKMLEGIGGDEKVCVIC